MNLPWLSILALLPAIGAVIVVIVGPRLAKEIALAAAVLTAVLAVIIALSFDPGGGMQLVEQVPWIRPLGAYYALGLDGIGLTLVLLVVIVTPVVILASWRDFDRSGLLGGASGSRSPHASTGQSRVAGAAAAARTTPAYPPGKNESLPPKYGPRVFFALVLAVESCALYLFLA